MSATHAPENARFLKNKINIWIFYLPKEKHFMNLMELILAIDGESGETTKVHA